MRTEGFRRWIEGVERWGMSAETIAERGVAR